MFRGTYSCPGETDPPTCRCACYGCKHHCAAHNPPRLYRWIASVDWRQFRHALLHRGPGYDLTDRRPETTEES
jgi:hypothetical protein